MTNNEIYEELLSICEKENVLKDEPMKNHTLTKLGGKADFFVTPVSYDQMSRIVAFTYNNKIPFMLLGNGSNMVVRDGGIRGIVVQFSKLNGLKREGNTIVAQGGANIIDASRLALKHSLTGFEFACGIPGSIGGAMAMNAGAYGGEVKDIINHVIVITKEGKQLKLSKEELELNYRSSIIGKKGHMVVEAVFTLENGDEKKIKEKMDDLTFQRESKQPLEYPSAGSVFKRPPGYFAGKLIQDSGLQGKGVGGAEVSTKHAGFIINKSNATATDYISTIEMVKTKVKENFGVDLELEVKIVGEDLNE
ncbi:UDP-N-acetylmuramate dehydrogenase [Alteribacter aurantiacus]|uniref:UDP-N-acetylmuramate dehydrogenase n=1 Tax=Alteribacter aurantiacus TaxID=254410 RepID=UPI000416F267|nr:UDP-N-acetylmuramate dehydrogenase [Alteribacter aurantiacus]